MYYTSTLSWLASAPSDRQISRKTRTGNNPLAYLRTMKRSVAIVGGGPSALLLAAHLDEDKFSVSIYERNGALGRKFLVAGDGGFNLTHSEDLPAFISRYTPAGFFEKIISQFSNTDLRAWLGSIGIETFVGSSRRVFPKEGIKPIQVLNAFLDQLQRKNVTVQTGHKWNGWKNRGLLFEVNYQPITAKADIVIFSLGGSSWKVTGSDGRWTHHFAEKGIDVVPFQPSNCAFAIGWRPDFLEMAEGRSLKNISISKDDKTILGEAVITKFGLEGGAIYALSGGIRSQLNNREEAEIFLDLKPQVSLEQIKEKFEGRGDRSIKKLLRDKMNFTDIQIELIKNALTKPEFTDTGILAERIKKLPLKIMAAAPIDEAISTVGGIALEEIDDNFQLKKLPGHYAIGEMLDWDAPTGGYLLQGCFSMGYALAKHLNG